MTYTHRDPLIVQRAARWDAMPQAAILWEALQVEKRNAEFWRLKYEAARASLETRYAQDNPGAEAGQ